MLQSIRDRLSQNPSSERQEIASGIPTSWPASRSYQSIKYSQSRVNTQDVEKGSFVSETADKTELRPLLLAASGPQTGIAALESPKARQTGLAMLQPPLDYKGPEDIAATRHSAAKHRDARFAQHTASVLSAAFREKPGSFKNQLFAYKYRPETEETLTFAQEGLTDRFGALQSIHLSIQPDKCQFDRELAEVYVHAILSEFNLLCQGIDLKHKHAPKMIELLIDHVTTSTDAILCDSETIREIEKTLALTVTHLAWKFVSEAQTNGRTHHLERYLSLHKKWQTYAVRVQSVGEKGSKIP